VYPDNPRLPAPLSASSLTDEDKRLIELNRSLVNFYMNAPCYHLKHKQPKPEIQTYSNRFAPQASSADSVMEQLVSAVGREYFPEECLTRHYVPPARRREAMRRKRQMDLQRKIAEEQLDQAGSRRGSASKEGEPAEGELRDDEDMSPSRYVAEEEAGYGDQDYQRDIHGDVEDGQDDQDDMDRDEGANDAEY